MKTIVCALIVLVFAGILVGPSYAQRDIDEAVVKVYTTYTAYDYDMPWQLSGQRQKYGSGCIISGNRVLTNAHLVADQTFIQVKRAGQAKKFNAEVEAVAHECDLAILKVSDDSFFAGVKPLTLGGLPRMRDKVAVYGFPMGGEELCITEGVVSRIEQDTYVHSGVELLTVQIDAAINPGSSGGPVIKDGKIVGIAFQGYFVVQNIGYMIPVPIVNHFLKDIAVGSHGGIPGLGIYMQKMENASLRAQVQMNDKETGVMVTYVIPGTSAHGTLKSGDVILSVEGIPIANDGTIRYRDIERINFRHLIHTKSMGETLQCSILRDGKRMNVHMTLHTPIGSLLLVPHSQYDKVPTYYILGPLVFQPLTLNYLDTWDDMRKAPVHLVNYYSYGKLSDERRQVIVLTKILGDELAAGYNEFKNHVITRVNGKTIAGIEDLVKAIEGAEGTYHVIMDEWGNQIVLERNKINEAQKTILKKYKIDADRSADLKGAGAQ